MEKIASKETARSDNARVAVDREREPLDTRRAKLHVPKEIEGYHLHWLNDDGMGRIEAAQRAGYEFVAPEEVGLAPNGTDSVKRVVGSGDQGGPLYAILMKQRLDWYEQDQKKLQEPVDRFEQQIREGSLEKVSQGYVPKGGISIKSKEAVNG